MSEVFDTLLLLALPASGKSEVRTYLEERDPARFHMGPTVQLDDYPYVHMQLRVDDVLADMGQAQLFHAPSDIGRNGPFKDKREFGALVRLVAEDYAAVCAGKLERPVSAAQRLFERFDAASEAAGGEAKIRALAPEIRARLVEALEAEARKLYDELATVVPATLEGKTVVIEFARGGPEGASMPLTGGFGYAGSLPHLPAELLRRSAILYIWVEPAESRRKNRARAKPGAQDSILFHGTPEVVMRGEYGTCDMAHLIETSDVPGTVRVETLDGEIVHVPVARFDNRVDKTSFLRDEPASWSDEDVALIHGGLLGTCDELWEAWVRSRKA